MGHVQKTISRLVDPKGNFIKPDSKTVEIKRKAAFEAIVKKAILVHMTCKQLANIPFDTTLVDNICKEMDIKNKSFIQVRKCILNPQHLINLRSLISDALLMVWNNTKPWDNSGYRILPMDYYDDFNETFSKIKDDFEEAVQTFIDNYDSYVNEAKKNLGKAFNKNDYPDKANLKQYFTLEIQTSKFPDIDDIRLNLTNNELCDMQDEIVQQYDSVIKTSINELFEMVKDENLDKDRCLKLFKLCKILNINDNGSINLELKTIEAKLKTKFGEDAFKEDEVKKDSMMMMDDLEDFDEDDLKDFSV